MVVRNPHLVLIIYLQLVVAAAITASPSISQTSWTFTGPALALDIVVAAFLTWRTLISVGATASSTSDTLLLRRLERLGLALVSLGLLCLGWAVFLRSRRQERDAAFGLLAALIVLALLLWWTSEARHAARNVSWVALGAALLLAPPLVGWVTGSLVWSLVGRSRSSLVQQQRRGDDAVRPSVACPERWAIQGQPLAIALTLSGGGYRAAIAHAGVLTALDEQCVPLTYISTVSGGSIVGANYALGISPRNFARHLITPPGLGNDLMDVRAIGVEWLSPWSGSADTYARHFQRIFFDNRRLRDLRDAPLLLINTTDLERHEPHVREVLFKGRSRATDDETLVAEAVAASGAFPGAFEPKRMRWPQYGAPVAAATSLTRRTFVDGGVVDNLGIEGLRYFLSLRTAANVPPGPTPTVLIVSDASQYPPGTNFPTMKVGPFTNLMRSLNMSWAALHRYMYSRVSGVDAFGVPGMIGYAPAREVFGAPAWANGDLFTVMLPTASPISEVVVQGCAFAKPGDSRHVAQEVSEYDTLAELNREQVLKAYWLGYAIGRRYAPVLEALRVYLIDASARSPQAAVQARERLDAVAQSVLRSSGPCPSRGDILKLLGET